MITKDKSKYRDADEYNEKYMMPIMDKIYTTLGFTFDRITNKKEQIGGLDIILHSKDSEYYVDEKCDCHRQLRIYDNSVPFNKRERDETTTFAVELSRLTRSKKRTNGWFHPQERETAINNYYAFIWTNHEKDFDGRGGKFTKISQIELCLISYDSLRKIVEAPYEEDFNYDKLIHDVLYYADLHDKQNDKIRFPDYNEFVHVTYSGNLFEKPINCVIRKSVLRQFAEYSYVFNFKGNHMKEEIDSYRELSTT